MFGAISNRQESVGRDSGLWKDIQQDYDVPLAEVLAVVGPSSVAIVVRFEGSSEQSGPWYSLFFDPQAHEDQANALIEAAVEDFESLIPESLSGWLLANGIDIERLRDNVEEQLQAIDQDFDLADYIDGLIGCIEWYGAVSAPMNGIPLVS